MHNSQAELTKVTGPDRYEAVSGAPGQCQFWSSERSEVHGQFIAAAIFERRGTRPIATVRVPGKPVREDSSPQYCIVWD